MQLSGHCTLCLVTEIEATHCEQVKSKTFLRVPHNFFSEWSFIICEHDCAPHSCLGFKCSFVQQCRLDRINIFLYLLYFKTLVIHRAAPVQKYGAHQGLRHAGYGRSADATVGSGCLQNPTPGRGLLQPRSLSPPRRETNNQHMGFPLEQGIPPPSPPHRGAQTISGSQPHLCVRAEALKKCCSGNSNSFRTAVIKVICLAFLPYDLKQTFQQNFIYI